MINNTYINKKMRLGDLMVQHKMISDEQLNYALTIQKQNGEKLGRVLVDLGYVTMENIYEILEFQLGIPYVDLDKYELKQEVLSLVTENMVKRHWFIPLKLNSDSLYIAMSDPLDIFAIDDVKIYTGLNIVPTIASEEKIKQAIELYYGKEAAIKAAEEYKKEKEFELHTASIDDSNVDEIVKSAPIVKIVNTIIEQAIRNRSSDIHIEPFEKTIRIRYRIDGILQEVMVYDVSLLAAIVARIKISGGLDIAEKRKPQDGRIGVKVDGREYDLRISILPTIFGEKVVMRITDKKGFNKKKEELGLFTDDLEKFDNIIKNPHGIILITGPTGSGKSTTMYTTLNEINRQDINIITVEDPVEANIPGINQVQVNTKVGLTFATALRSILRQDPDIIMIGEIRDNETAEIAVKASITGHLVVSTLHTNDAASSITRLIDMSVEPYLISGSIVGVIAQRLVRKLCPHCKEGYELSDREKYILNVDVHHTKIYRAVGCHFCRGTGYLGRIGVYEIMPVTQSLRQLINQRATTDQIKQKAISEGMKTLKNNAIRLVIDGKISIDELLSITYSVE